ncbi:SDR family oxidoreductase, partial [Nocardia abscessus]|uniref:SDR family oxidoreductase n=1 Tax=Nocardia abscessus TaxID=120957 RepID=UPI00245665F2
MTNNNPIGRVAVVTGASSGIGAATARQLAQGGAKVALLGRRKDRIEELAAEIGGDALAVGGAGRGPRAQPPSPPPPAGGRGRGPARGRPRPPPPPRARPRRSRRRVLRC